MGFIISFIVGFCLNEGRILYRVFGSNIRYIKNKFIIKELGYRYLLFFFFLNFSKGIILFHLLSDYSYIYNIILTSSLIIGLYLGAKPLSPEGSELTVFMGIIASYNWEAIQISIALSLSILILSKNLKLSLLVLGIINSLFLIHYNYYLSFLALSLLVNYARYKYALFSLLANTINKKMNFPIFKGVKSINESILYTFTKIFKKCIEKSY